jgi:hypothetical protein
MRREGSSVNRSSAWPRDEFQGHVACIGWWSARYRGAPRPHLHSVTGPQRGSWHSDTTRSLEQHALAYSFTDAYVGLTARGQMHPATRRPRGRAHEEEAHAGSSAPWSIDPRPRHAMAHGHGTRCVIQFRRCRRRRWSGPAPAPAPKWHELLARILIWIYYSLHTSSIPVVPVSSLTHPPPGTGHPNARGLDKSM